MMITLRSHYTVDMLAALIFAHYFYIIADKHSYVFDLFVFGIGKKESTQNKNNDSEKFNSDRLYYLACNNCIHLLAENDQRLVAMPIVRNCSHPMVSTLKSSDVTERPVNQLSLNETITENEEIVSTTSQTTKARDEEMYSLI